MLLRDSVQVLDFYFLTSLAQSALVVQNYRTLSERLTQWENLFARHSTLNALHDRGFLQMCSVSKRFGGDNDSLL